ncbi:hypothetical protein L2E82_28554 [Cichorium intybus]|uniref:Uncharacterized protein n=1 Tax=Cichorium intybus TaxID=13427 RepID=A0ACB9CW92_CICIN|nr:hypothetical protein L2E82_28554 [Cichorium intybus]
MSLVYLFAGTSTLDTVSVFKDICVKIRVLSGLLYHVVTDSKSGSRLSSSRFGSDMSLVYLVGAVTTQRKEEQQPPSPTIAMLVVASDEGRLVDESTAILGSIYDNEA